MWYLTWILGLVFAVALTVASAMWLEAQGEQNKESK